jgi:tRNA threonylcarbamoyl adenosine modification protein YeaZ
MGHTLAIEISNPASGPRGEMPVAGSGEPVLAGPGVGLAQMDGSSVRIIGIELLSAGLRHDDDLMPAIDRLCRRAGVGPRQLGRIAVSIGPGGYTSLRIAVATAKMLCEATGAEAVPVASAPAAALLAGEGVLAGSRLSSQRDALHMLLASRHPATLVCLASKGETAWCELLPPPRDDPWWQGVGGEALAELLPAEQQREIEQRAAAGLQWISARVPLGILDAAGLELLRPAMVIADQFLPQSMRSALASIGAVLREPVFAPESVLHLSADAPAVDPLGLAPLYPREPEAVVQWRRRGR